MSSGQFRTLKKQFEELLGQEKLGAKNKEKLVSAICSLYENLGRDAANQEHEEVYELYDLSTHIFKAANQEVVDNDAKWNKEKGKESRGQSKSYKTRLFELSIYHMKNCCQKRLDHNNVPWIQYSLAVLQKPWILSEVSMESELSTCLLSCANASFLHWAQHHHLRQLWEFIWSRIEDHCLEMSILKNYVELAVKIMKGVEVTVFETSPFHVVRTVLLTLKAAAEKADFKFWTHSRKYSFVHVLSYVVRRWGLEARDLILREIFHVLDKLTTLISVDQSGIEDSKSFMMQLTDDLIKLAVIEKIGSHRTIDEKTEEHVKDLLRTGITDALKSAHVLFGNKVQFSISEEYVRYLARWILAAREVDPPPTPDHSFEMECTSTKKKDHAKSYSYQGLVELSFGENILPNANKCNAWSGAMRILKEVIASRKLDAGEIGRIVASLWSKRKMFSTDALRVTFCSLLATTISENVQFGSKQIPSIDLLLKYALSLMSNVASIPDSAHLVESILRFRSCEVPKEMLRVICDTVSRTNPSSVAVLRLISAFISYTEFDEGSRFCSINDEPKGSWTLRKDVVDWLLADPSANCHKLIYQLCQYHPVFCFELQKAPQEDALLRSLKKCGLRKKAELQSEPLFRPLDAEIREMVSYVKGELQCLLASELSLPSFVISYEFSLKSPETSIDLSSVYPKIQLVSEGLDQSAFRESVEQFTVWPEKFELPKHDSESLLVFFLASLDNQLLKLNPWLSRKEELVEVLAEHATRDPILRSRIQKAMPFNQFVKKHILDNIGDLYETTKKFDRFSFLLSHRNMLATRALIRKESEEQLKVGDSIYETDMILFENITASVCVRNATGGNLIGGFDLDPFVVASYPEHVCFNDRSVLKYLKELKKSPFLAQNIVRHVLGSGKMWHLHTKVLAFVMRNEKLLSVCIATIPNMIRFLRVYQMHFDPNSEITRFLNFDAQSIRKCQNYARRPKKNGQSINPDDLILLFGMHLNRWRTVLFRFWKLFEKDPATICGKIHQFAEECVDLGLTHRFVCLMKAISTSDLARRILSDPHLRIVYSLMYRSVFSIVIKKDCSQEIVEMCWDTRLKYDLYQHTIKKVPASHLDDFMRFETEIAFSVEKFLQHGVETENIDFNDFGLIEFYRQLNENLSEDVIKINDAREKYLIDFLSSMWLLVPSMRPHIVPIVARFKHISLAWTRFPQPPHITCNENSFIWRLRFSLAMKITACGKWKRGELSTCTSLLLNSLDPSRFAYRSDLIPPNQLTRLKEDTKRDVLCILSRILRVEAISEKNKECEERGIEWEVFDSAARAASLFTDIAACTVPFLFKICVDFHMKYDFSLGKLLACLKGVNKEDTQVVYCLAECVDSLGLDVLARYERLDDASDPSTATHWFFVLSRLFLKHGFLTHSFAVANIIFDRLSRQQRNVMMIERISLDSVAKSKEIIELLVEIYVAEGNSVALASLPSSVQTRPDVRQVMHKESKDWLRLVSSGLLETHELIVVRWMCGLPSDDTDKYLDSVLRGRFADYPKLIDTPLKCVYFLLFHLEIETDVSSVINDIMSRMIEKLKIEDVRLLMLASDEANFEPQTVEEHVVLAIRNLRETTGRRKRMESSFVKEVNEKTVQMMKLAAILVENKAFEAASLLLGQWKEECAAWSSPSVDMALVEICQLDIMCKAGDTRMAETNLRAMQPRVGQMSDVAVAEWTLVLSNITFDFRNNLDEGIRLLERGCRLLQSCESIEARLKVLLKFHSVCVNQLSKLEEYRESRSFRMKQQAISAFEKQISNSRMSRASSGDDKRTVHRVQKEQQCEKDDVAKVENRVITAVLKAVSSAFNALDCISQLADDEEALRAASLIIFPLIDVIYKYEQVPEVVNLVKEHATTKLKSKFWLCATSHIASKCFSVEPSPLQRSLYLILSQIIRDYPYHVLHTILMYEFESNGSRVKTFLNSVLTKPGRDVSKLKEIIESMREAHSAYRELARLETKDHSRLQRVQIDGKTMLRMPSELKIFKCKLKSLPIPTITQKIGYAGDYTTNGLITWKSWKGVFSIADGLSAPKIWEVQGSDGKFYRTVWKKDDVRQDVLVEQMFDVTNNMLEKRMLRTYKVVPLDTECGIIEFCGGTVSIKELLCGVTRDKGLHSQFNPGEPSASKVSLKMRECQNESTEARCRVFVDICREYSPVFRHFFYTNFSTAHIWRDKITEYRKSLATWSVVCYIVGLGDRHASNILFDQKLCTFVHIDLGMILEYSKRTLPVPEQVPFRISRDLLDPILIEGIENGQLANECTEIIEKLKQNGKVILGVASALLRETMTNFRETEQASGRPSYISEMAIGRLRDKLSGTDDGVTAQSSNLQVRRLLREATNADNLSRMFCGWMPFL